MIFSVDSAAKIVFFAERPKQKSKKKQRSREKRETSADKC
jgi:hypothetical protein